MDNYISVNTIQAKEMTRGKYNEYKGWTLPANENPNDKGYLIKNIDETETWKPKKFFEKHFFKLEDNSNLKTLNKKDVDNFIKDYKVIQYNGDTYLEATLINKMFIKVKITSTVNKAKAKIRLTVFESLKIMNRFGTVGLI